MSTTDFSKQISKMSSDKLRKIVFNSIDYQKEFVLLAENELLNRGIPITQDEKDVIELAKKARELDDQDDIKFRKFIFDFGHNSVTSNEYPKLYSRQIIIIFSSFFSGVFGGILMSYNLLQINKARYIPIVLLVSIIFSALFVWALSVGTSQDHIFDNLHFRSMFVSNTCASVLIYSRLWWKYIGEKTKFRTKSILIPLIIGMVLIILFVTNYLNN